MARWSALLGCLLLLMSCAKERDGADISKEAPADRLDQTDAGSRPAMTAVSRDTFVVQVASFRDAGNAARERRKLARKKFRSYVERAEIPGQGVWFRLRVGPFSDRSVADSVLQSLKASGYTDAYAVTVRAAPVTASVVKVPSDTETVATDSMQAAAPFEVTRLTRVGSCRNPRWSPRGREIAFFTASEGKGGIFAVGTGGGPLFPLVMANDTLAPTPKFAWSPSAKRIAYVALEEIPWGRRTRLVESLWLRPRQGGAAEKISRQERYPFDIEAISWSPSGNWIAFNANFGGEDAHSDRIQDVRVIEVETAQTTKVSERGTGWVVGWTDDERLLYLQTYDRMSHSLNFGYEIWSFDPGSGSRQRLLSGPVVKNSRKVVYANRKRAVVYSRFRTEPDATLYVDALVAVDLVTGHRRVLFTANREDRLSADFAVSATGHVAFMRQGVLWLTNLDGVEPSELLDSAGQLDWSPDGESLVCVRDGDLFRVKLAKVP